MKLIDYLLLGAVALAVLAAVGSFLKRRKQGKACDGNCSHCDHHCGT